MRLRVGGRGQNDIFSNFFVFFLYHLLEVSIPINFFLFCFFFIFVFYWSVFGFLAPFNILNGLPAITNKTTIIH